MVSFSFPMRRKHTETRPPRVVAESLQVQPQDCSERRFKDYDRTSIAHSSLASKFYIEPQQINIVLLFYMSWFDGMLSRILDVAFAVVECISDPTLLCNVHGFVFENGTTSLQFRGFFNEPISSSRPSSPCASEMELISWTCFL